METHLETGENTIMYLSLGQAAKEAGKSKSVISKALKAGKLAYAEKDDTGYKIDPAELFRVFPREPFQNGQKERLETHLETGENTIKIKELEIRLETTLERLNDKELQIEDLRQERDDWKGQAQRLALAAPNDNRKQPDGHGKEIGGEIAEKYKNASTAKFMALALILVSLGVLGALLFLQAQG